MHTPTILFPNPATWVRPYPCITTVFPHQSSPCSLCHFHNYGFQKCCGGEGVMEQGRSEPDKPCTSGAEPCHSQDRRGAGSRGSAPLLVFNHPIAYSPRRRLAPPPSRRRARDSALTSQLFLSVCTTCYSGKTNPTTLLLETALCCRHGPTLAASHLR